MTPQPETAKESSNGSSPFSEETLAKVSALELSDLGNPPSLKNLLRLIEQHLITKQLNHSAGRVTHAAKALGWNHHQSLISVLDTRHQDLPRLPKRKRRKPLMTR